MILLNIKDDQSYEDFCNRVDKGLVITELAKPYINTEDGKIIVAKQYSFVFDDLFDYLTGKIDENKNPQNRKYVTVTTQEQLAEMIAHIDLYEFLSCDIETTDLSIQTGTIIGFSVCGKAGEAYYLPHKQWITESQELVDVFSYDTVKATLKLLKGKSLLTWNGSFDLRYIEKFFKVNLYDELYADGMLMKHCFAEEGDFSLKGNAKLFQTEIGIDVEQEANQEQIEIKENVIKNGGVLTKANYELYKADLQVMGKYACADADLTFRLCTLFQKKLEEENLEEFFYDKEVMPLYREVVITMEKNGVKLDLPLIEDTKKSIIDDISMLEKEVVDFLFSLDEVKKWKEESAIREYPISRKGKFATKVVEKLGLPLERSKTGSFSFTEKNIQKLPDSEGKSFLLGEKELDAELAKSISVGLFEELEPLNISSKKQMGQIVFDYLKIKSLGKTDGGSPQFNEEFIQYLADEYKYNWAKSLSNYNKLIKIKGTYIDRFLEAHIDGYYYFSYKQHGTISGRLSGDAQQLPRPKEEGEVDEIVRKYINVIRAFFISGEGRAFIDCDYESLEPHIFAHVSGDEGLRDIFRKGHDFYSTIAIATEKIEGVSADKKAPNYLGKMMKPVRQKSKAYSLGVPYGMTDYALGKSLDMTTEEAKVLIEGYLNGFPELKKWMKRSEQLAHTEGKIVTEAGRIRHLPRAKELYKIHGTKLLDYRYRNSIKKQYGTEAVLNMYRDYKNSVNNAKNVQIQSLGASIINKACIAIMREFKKRNIDAWICAQIHDQAIFNVPEDRVEECKILVKDLMENTTKISIDLKAPPAVAHNWRDSH